MKTELSILVTILLFLCGPSYSQDDIDYYNRAVIEYEARDYRAAVEALTNSIKINPAEKDTYNMRGLAYYQLNLFGLALQDFDKTLELDYNIPGQGIDAAPHAVLRGTKWVMK